MMRAWAGIALLLTSGAAIAKKPINADEHEKASDPDDKMICKRFLVTGSLVQSKRLCKTKREWERDRDEINRVNQNRSCLGDAANCKW